MKVFWLFNHPAPYKVDFLNELGKTCDLTVYFERGMEVGRNSTFYSEKASNFRCTICKPLILGGINNYTSVPLKDLKKNRYDLIVMNGWYTKTERCAISYLKRHHIPYVFYINGGIIKESESSLKRWFKTKYIKGAASYFCPDENSVNYLLHYGAEKEKIVIYPYSSIYEREVLKAPLPFEEKLKIREEYGIKGDKVFISSGQFIERKNFKELISVWKDIPSEYTLLLVGEGEQEQEYRSLIEEHSLSNIVLMPFKKHGELLRLFSACDAFIFLSKEDIYGHVINEALSQGLPVISSDHVNAARHLVKNGENGFLVQLGDSENIKTAIMEIGEKSLEENAIKTANDNTQEISASFHTDAFSKLVEVFSK